MKWVRRIVYAVSGGVIAIAVLLVLWLASLPYSAFTQITVETASNHDIRIHSIRFGGKVAQFTRPLKASRGEDQKIMEYQIIYFQDVNHEQGTFQVWYTEIDTGRRRYGEFVADLTPRSTCQFVLFFRDDGPEL